MPKWALPATLRSRNPWGLPARILEPAKVDTDPIHGDVYLNRLEQAFVDSPPFQRLRRVRQLGTTHLVYPAATHSRFSHSLGALRAAQDLLDIVVDQRNSRRRVQDLFHEWGSGPEYERRLAEATVLVRLGALLHDLCHVPFGHSIEDELQILTPHDENGPRYELLWTEATSFVTERLGLEIPFSQLASTKASYDGTALADELRPLILSKEGSGEPWKQISYPFAADIIGNTISADLIDYLQRDHYFTGLPIALGHRFLDAFYVTRSTHRDYPKRMALRIAEKRGEERPDTISELLKYLRYRYELSERALVHHAKLAADAMVGKALQMRYDAAFIEAAIERDGKLASAEPRDIDGFRAQVEELGGATAVREAEAFARQELEDLFLSAGDDELLTQLALEHPSSDDERRAGVRKLATAIVRRRLFKRIGTARAEGEAERIWKAWGSPDARRRLEKEVAAFASINPGWQIVVWVPPPKMRLKAAEVLVDDRRKIRPFVERERAQKQERGEEIYDSHQALWRVSVFLSRQLSELQEHIVLAYIAERMDLEWDDRSLPTVVWDLAIEEVSDRDPLTRAQKRDLIDAQPAFWGGSAEATADATFDDVLSNANEAATALREDGEIAQPDEGTQEPLV